MKKVFIQTPFEDETTFKEYQISHLSYSDFFKTKRNLSEIIRLGYSGSSLFWKFRNPEHIQKLYLEKDPEYFNFLYAFKEKFGDYDIIVMNPGVDLVHPEFLTQHFPNSIKCLHFVDDPHASYSYGFPYAWAFDAATYISPSFNWDFSMQQILRAVGFSKIKWFPLSVSNIDPPKYTKQELVDQIEKRNNKAVYIGNFYKSKNDRLLQIKKELGSTFDIFGKYPLRGYKFITEALLKGNLMPYQIKQLSERQREIIYQNYSIALNMHLSFPSLETGNARLYEVAYRGLAQVCDSSEFSLVSEIFEPDKEILLYTNHRECIEQIRRLQNNKNLRNEIAIAGYERSVNFYNYNKNLLETLDWLAAIKKEERNH